MANFASVGTYLESLISSQLSATLTTQGAWEWYNALFRVMSANRFTGTPRVVGPLVAVTGSNTIETNAVRLFGVLIQNGGTENSYTEASNVAVTGGNDDTLGPMLYCPSATTTEYLFTDGLAFSAGLFFDVILATNTALEAGTEISAANLLLHKTIWVYTE
jgi:hypothetical protein